jgi:pterin-4a-carbinolamine dehydratase
MLCGWEIVKSTLPEDVSVTREELFKTYQFKNFKQAIDFMTQVAQGCELHGHHPRWENIWNRINVYLTTWGVGYRITDRDIRLAQYLDKSYKKYPGTVSEK